jgi:hypothetical protein
VLAVPIVEMRSAIDEIAPFLEPSQLVLDVGSVKVGGLSAAAAEQLIANALKNGNFVKQPQVTLVVMQVRGNQASVLGQVNRPGRYPIEVSQAQPKLGFEGVLA